MTALTAFQMHSATSGEGDALMVDGKKVGLVTMVGVVRNIESKTTKVTYRIQDHTGAIDCAEWIDSDDGEAKELGVRGGSMFSNITRHL